MGWFKETSVFGNCTTGFSHGFFPIKLWLSMACFPVLHDFPMTPSTEVVKHTGDLCVCELCLDSKRGADLDHRSTPDEWQNPGKRLHSELENHYVSWVNPLFRLGHFQ